MRSVEDRHLVQALLGEGLNDCEIARRTAIPRSTVRMWRVGPKRHATQRSSCARCGHAAHDWSDLPARQYSHLLGLYLGDGSIVVNRRGVFRLRITLDKRYPQIIAGCAASVEAMIGKAAGFAYKPGCVDVSLYSKSWPCFFPQHARGRKHERRIALTEWQQAIVDQEPRELVRGLIESDGCRFMNRVRVGGKTYEYSRYTFSNVSSDIRGIFTHACDALGIEWKQMNAVNISVARRASVAKLDEFVGPKR